MRCLYGRIGNSSVQTDAGQNHVLRCVENNEGLLDGNWKKLLLQDVLEWQLRLQFRLQLRFGQRQQQLRLGLQLGIGL